MDAALLAALGRELAPGLRLDQAALEAAATDDSGLRYQPQAVFFPRNADEVARLMGLAARYGFPVTPRGPAPACAAVAWPRKAAWWSIPRP